MTDDIAQLRDLLREGRYAEVHASATARLAHSPDDVEALSLVGASAFFLGRDAAALEALDRALALAPAHAPARYHRGLARMYAGQPEGAIDDLEALERQAAPSPPLWAVLDALGDAYRGADNPERAAAAWERALAAGSQRGRTLSGLGQLVVDADPPRAAELFARALEVEPKDLQARYNLGQILQNQQQPARALEQFEALAQLAPDDPEAAKKIVQLLNALGRFDEADARKPQMFALAAGSSDPRVREQRETCIDQFRADRFACLVYERVDKTVRDLMYWWTCRVVDGSRVVATINLETSPMLQSGELGGDEGARFLLGMNNAQGHTTFARGWRSPDYREFRQAVLDVLAGRVRAASALR